MMYMKVMKVIIDEVLVGICDEWRNETFLKLPSLPL